MPDWWDAALPGLFALGGVIVAGWLTGRADSRKWRRDYLIARISSLHTRLADLIEVVDEQLVLCGQAVDALKGLRDPVPDDRVTAVGLQWRRVFSRTKVELPAAIQDAIVKFDVARGGVAEAVNAGRHNVAVDALLKLEVARSVLVDEINVTVRDVNETLAPFVTSGSERLWARLRGQPLVPDMTRLPERPDDGS